MLTPFTHIKGWKDEKKVPREGNYGLFDMPGTVRNSNKKERLEDKRGTNTLFY